MTSLSSFESNDERVNQRCCSHELCLTVPAIRIGDRCIDCTYSSDETLELCPVAAVKTCFCSRLGDGNIPKS